MREPARRTRHLIGKAILALAGAILATGCMSVHREAERIHLARHPIREARMSERPGEGLVPCGVWRIRGARNTVYLAGTSHIVGTNQIPFPSPFYAAYQDSREIYVEANVQSPFTTLRLLPKVLKWTLSHRDEFVCPKGRTLADYLSPETLARLQTFYGRDFRRERMTPLFLLLMNEGADLSGASENNGGVEDVFALLARKDGKPIGELDDKEIADTALAMMDEMLAKWRADIARLGADAVVQKEILEGDELDDAIWRRGDMAAVERAHAEIKSEIPSLFEKALPERNRKWMARLKVVLQGRRNVMVLVGVAHLGGKEGLLQMLKEAGFNPEQMYGVDRPAAASAPRPR